MRHQVQARRLEEACLPELGPRPGWKRTELEATARLGRTLKLFRGGLWEPSSVSG